MALDKVIDSAKLDAALLETANAIRKKTGGTEPISFDETQGFKSAVESIDTKTHYNQGYEDGKKQGFTDGYETKELEGGYERYASHFKVKSFNLFGKKEIVLNLDNATTLDGLMSLTQGYNTGLQNTVVEHLTINCPNQVKVFQMMLNYDNLNVEFTLKRLTFNVDTQKGTHFGYFIRNTRALEVIDGTPLDFSSVTSKISPFRGCALLKEIRFKGSINNNFDLSNLSAVSVETMKSAILCLTNFAGTDKEFAYTVQFPEDKWEALEADSLSPNGNSWREYVDSLGWLN